MFPYGSSGTTDDGCSGRTDHGIGEICCSITACSVIQGTNQVHIGTIGSDQVDVQITNPCMGNVEFNINGSDHCVSRDTGYGDRADDTEFVIIRNGHTQCA